MVGKYRFYSLKNEEKRFSVIVFSQTVAASDHLPDCHPSLFFQLDTLVF